MAASLKDYLQQKRAPLMVYLELTHRCSFLCTHCYIPAELRQPTDAKARRAPLGLSTEEVKRLLDQLADAQALFLVLTGGEIFLRPDLQEIGDYAVRKGFSLKFYTNGFHITPRWADQLQAWGVYAVDMSIYGATESTYQKITQVKGGLKRALQSLKLLRERHIRVTVKTPVLKENADEIPALKELAQAHGATFRYDLVIIPRFDGDQTPLDQQLDEGEVELLMQRLNAKFTAKETADFEPHLCAVGKWSAVVSPLGEVYPCIEWRESLGNVKQQSFSQIWTDNPKMQEIRATLARMQPDPAFADGLCGHCPAHSLHTTGDMTKPAPINLKLAAVKRKFLVTAP